MIDVSATASERGSNKENSFQPTHQRVDLQFFERRGGRCIIKHLNDGSLEIHSGINSDLLAIGAHLLVEALLTSRRAATPEDFIGGTEMKQLQLQMLEGFDKDQAVLNHEQTLRGLLNSGFRKLEMLKEEQFVFTRFELNHIVAATINNHPALEFALVALVRAKGSLQLSENLEKYKYTLFGNEERLLRDYSANLRNVPLKLVSDAVGVSLLIDYQGCVEEYHCSSHSVKLHIASNRNNRSVLKYEHSQQSQSLPGSVHDGIPLDIGASRRVNSRLSIGSNSDYRCNETSRSKPSKTCPHCGRVKTERFCECRKNGTPKNSQKGSSSALRSLESSKPNKSIILNGSSSSSRKCRKCKTMRQLFMDDEYCGECIGVYGIKRCSNCNQLYELSCARCRRF